MGGVKEDLVGYPSGTLRMHVRIFNSGFMNKAAKYCLPFMGLPGKDDA